jgi:hypothetical protein
VPAGVNAAEIGALSPASARTITVTVDTTVSTP